MNDQDKANASNYNKGFVTELSALLNKYSMENGSDTPDYVLAEYLNAVLQNFNYAVRFRESARNVQANTTPKSELANPSPTDVKV